MHRLLSLTLAVCVLFPTTGAAETAFELSFEEAVALAMRGAPTARVATADIDVAEAGVVDARLSAVSNPSLELSAGPRFGDATTVDVEVALQQPVTLGGRGRAAVALAEQNVRVVRAQTAQTALQAGERVALGYLRSLHARRRLEIARESRELGGRVAEIAMRRFEAGETDRLQANTAQLAAGRLDVEVVVWESRYSARLGELRSLLGLAPERELILTSELELPTLPPIAELERRAATRPAIAALTAASEREAQREALGESMRWPELSLGAAYAREESAHIVLGLVSVSLPFFSHGQAVRALASAQRERIEVELDAAQKTLRAELYAARNNYDNLRAAETAFRNGVVPTIEENEAMMRQAYEAGAVDLPMLLTLRAESIAAKETYADLLLEVGNAHIHTLALTGSLTE